MTEIISTIVLPDNRTTRDGVVTLRLSSPVKFGGRVHSALPVSFPIINSVIRIQVIPNENSLPIDNFYHVTMNIDSLTYTTKWWIRDQNTQVFETLIPGSGTPPVLLESDPRVQKLLEDINPENGIPDLAERLRWRRIPLDHSQFNGTTDTFDIPTFVDNTLVVILNGIQEDVSNYTEMDNSKVIFNIAPVAEDRVYLEFYGV